MKRIVKDFLKKTIAYTVILFLVFNFTFQIDLFYNPKNVTANAATNLLKGGDFETDINTYWSIWNTSTSRTYDKFRSYDAPYGYGSYALGIQSKGAPGARFDAGLITDETGNYVGLAAGKNYAFTFMAKSSANMKVQVFAERADNFKAITTISEHAIGNSWQKYIVTFTPTESANALVTFVFGDMPENSILYLDGIGINESNISLISTEIKGMIGETNKKILTSDLSLYSLNDIQIELPYYNSQTGETSIKRFNPEKMDMTGVYINFYTGTYGGVGKLYVAGNPVGQFNYSVAPKVTDFYPSIVRADADVTLIGSGFSPVPNNTFIIVKAIDTAGKRYDYWVKPHSIDPYLQQMTVTLPVGVVSGSIYVRTSFWNTASTDTVTNSNSLTYKVKPKIYKAEWSSRGFDQVGDKLTIHGKGISNNTQINFYNSKGVRVDRKTAKVKLIDTEEVVEVATPKNQNKLTITAECDTVESDMTEALVYAAKPRLTMIMTAFRRQMLDSNSYIPAAKVDSALEVRGEGFDTETVEVEFQGYGQRVRVKPISVTATSIKLAVPTGVQSGYLSVVSSNESSNFLPLEIIPTVVSVNPDPVEPGKIMTIITNGSGDNVNAARVYFKLTDNSEVVVYPDSITIKDGQALISLIAPLSLSNKYSSLSVQYDKWRDDGKAMLNVRPYIMGASFDQDTKTLIIEGYGFSIIPKENLITYKYADENKTPVTPKATILGVYPTEGGQEIRIKIADDYHFGHVSVTVGDNISNEVNFGPVYIRKIARRVEYVKTENKVMGVLYITGNNFGTEGGVKVGDTWANVHYRSDYFIIAVVEKENINGNPVIVAK